MVSQHPEPTYTLAQWVEYRAKVATLLKQSGDKRADASLYGSVDRLLGAGAISLEWLRSEES